MLYPIIEKFVKAKREDFDNTCYPADSIADLMIFRQSMCLSEDGKRMIEYLHPEQETK